MRLAARFDILDRPGWNQKKAVLNCSEAELGIASCRSLRRESCVWYADGDILNLSGSYALCSWRTFSAYQLFWQMFQKRPKSMNTHHAQRCWGLLKNRQRDWWKLRIFAGRRRRESLLLLSQQVIWEKESELETSWKIRKRMLLPTSDDSGSMENQWATVQKPMMRRNEYRQMRGQMSFWSGYIMKPLHCIRYDLSGCLNLDLDRLKNVVISVKWIWPMNGLFCIIWLIWKNIFIQKVKRSNIDANVICRQEKLQILQGKQ